MPTNAANKRQRKQHVEGMSDPRRPRNGIANTMATSRPGTMKIGTMPHSPGNKCENSYTPTKNHSGRAAL